MSKITSITLATLVCTSFGQSKCANIYLPQAIAARAVTSVIKPKTRTFKQRVTRNPTINELLDTLNMLQPKHALAYIMWAIKQDKNDIHKNMTAHAGHGVELPETELTFLQNRDKITRPAIEQTLGIQIPAKAARIAWAGSGGGYRAICFNLGFLRAMEETGLFDTVTYLGGVSGSTWLLGAWLRHQTSIKNLTHLLEKQFKNPLIDDFDLTEAIKMGVLRKLCGAELTLVHLFGMFLAKRMFGDHALSYHIRLSDFEPLFLDKNAKTPPLPFYTAGGAHDPETISVAFSPLNTFIDSYNKKTGKYSHTNYPTWALGRRWKRGKTTYGMSEHFGYVLGICGSAFTVNIAEAAERYQSMLPEALFEAAHWIKIGKEQMRLSPGYHWNPDYKVPRRPYYNEKRSFLVDFGVKRNCGCVEALMAPERDVQILFIGDASGNVTGAPMLRAEQERANLIGRSFPEIDYDSIDDQPLHIFKNDDLLIIYLMFQNQHDTPLTNTFVTNYNNPPEAIAAMSDKAYNIIMDNEAKIKDAMKQFLQRKIT
ncbi:hypothetical protein HOL34_03185 [bacterium]|jgi:hypothetical protein|nr:hypothetical protein [bacterium]MBT5346193.1 hypothetical protein [bacterium]MBT6130989.1 hypothetical protein [bacterium]MBT6529082.1 hypothetical protein [bacterium]